MLADNTKGKVSVALVPSWAIEYSRFEADTGISSGATMGVCFSLMKFFHIDQGFQIPPVDIGILQDYNEDVDADAPTDMLDPDEEEADVDEDPKISDDKRGAPPTVGKAKESDEEVGSLDKKPAAEKFHDSRSDPGTDSPASEGHRLFWDDIYPLVRVRVAATQTTAAAEYLIAMPSNRYLTDNNHKLYLKIGNSDLATSRYWAMELIGCHQVRELTSNNVMNYFKSKGIPSVQPGKILEIVSYFSPLYPQLVVEDNFRLISSDSKFLSYHTRATSTPVLLKKMVDSLGRYAERFLSAEDLQTIHIAFNNLHDGSLVENISEKAIALADVYLEVYDCRPDVWYQGTKARANSNPSDIKIWQVILKKMKSITTSADDIDEVVTLDELLESTHAGDISAPSKESVTRVKTLRRLGKLVDTARVARAEARINARADDRILDALIDEATAYVTGIAPPQAPARGGGRG